MHLHCTLLSNAPARAMVNTTLHYYVKNIHTCPATLFPFSKSFTKLFVAGLSHDTNETILRDAFTLYGEIIQVKVICDHTSSRSKGYGFVKFASEAEASLAVRQMNGQVIDGTEIHVDYANRQ